MKKPVRTGFTLVELLITIAVIAVLSSMMVLSSAESVASAKASNIISDMATIRTAALAYLADHVEEIDEAVNFDLYAVSGDVMKYLDPSTLHDNKYVLSNLFYLSGHGDEDKWFVWCKVTDGRVKKKLKKRAQSLNLLCTWEDASRGVNYWGADQAKPFSENDNVYIGMQIY